MMKGVKRKPVDEQAWQPWVEQVAASVGMDASHVSIHPIHELSSAVSHARSRPMAPVAAYIWGLAERLRPDVAPDELRRAIADAAERR